MAGGIPQGRSRRGSLRDSGGDGLAASKGSAVSKTTSGSDLVDTGIDAGMDKAAAAVSKAGVKGKVAAAALKNQHVRDAVKNVAGDKLEQAKDAIADSGLAGQGAASNAAATARSLFPSPAQRATSVPDRTQGVPAGSSGMEAESLPPDAAKTTPRGTLRSPVSSGSLLSPHRRGLLGRKSPVARMAGHVITAPARMAMLPFIIPLLILLLILTIVMAMALGQAIGGDDEVIEQKKQFVPIVNVHRGCEEDNSNAATPGSSGGTSVSGTTQISNFPFICQNPELPTGCEVTSLTMVLNFYGVDVSNEVHL